MRIYNNFKEMYSEVGRDLVELGILVPSHSVQNYNPDLVCCPEGTAAEWNKMHDAKEITGYAYRLQDSFSWREVLEKDERNYVDKEVYDRMDFYYQNPGRAFRARLEVWEQYRDNDGEFDYTYNERIRTQLRMEYTQ